jgi:hypothetical protein
MMGAVPFMSKCPVTIVTQDSETFGEVVSNQPIVDRPKSLSGHLFAMNITASINVIYGEEPNNHFTAASTFRGVAPVVFKHSQTSFGIQNVLTSCTAFFTPTLKTIRHIFTTKPIFRSKRFFLTTLGTDFHTFGCIGIFLATLAACGRIRTGLAVRLVATRFAPMPPPVLWRERFLDMTAWACLGQRVSRFGFWFLFTKATATLFARIRKAISVPAIAMPELVGAFFERATLVTQFRPINWLRFRSTFSHFFILLGGLNLCGGLLQELSFKGLPKAIAHSGHPH